MSVMKLSEAIMMAGIEKPQGFGGSSMHSASAPCALGGALQSVGVRQIYEEVVRLWPWTEKHCHSCPRYDCRVGQLAHYTAYDIVIHLNDYHRWTRTQIAEWVSTIEPKEEIAAEEVSAEQKEPVYA